MGAIRLDTTYAPLMTFTAEGDLAYPQVLDHFKEYRALLDRDVPYVALFDARRVGTADARCRKAYAEFLGANAQDLRRLCKGAAFVVTSSLIQGTITAVSWLTPLPFPHRTFTRRAEARAWLRERLLGEDAMLLPG